MVVGAESKWYATVQTYNLERYSGFAHITSIETALKGALSVFLLAKVDHSDRTQLIKLNKFLCKNHPFLERRASLTNCKLQYTCIFLLGPKSQRLLLELLESANTSTPSLKVGGCHNHHFSNYKWKSLSL